MAKPGETLPPLDFEKASPVEVLQRYQRPIIAGVVVLAVVIGGGWMYKRSAQIKEQRAMEALAATEGAFTQSGAAGVQVELGRVATRYAGTAGGAQAAIVSGQLYLEAGHADSALMRVEPAISKAPSHLRTGLYTLQAAAKVAQGDLAAGAEAYEAAAAASQFTQERDQLLITAALTKLDAGDAAGAVSILEPIANREDSQHSAEARLRLGEAKAKL